MAGKPFQIGQYLQNDDFYRGIANFELGLVP